MLMKILKIGAIELVVIGVTVRFGLPHLLTGFGLHPHYKVPAIDLSGKPKRTVCLLYTSPSPRDS